MKNVLLTTAAAALIFGFATSANSAETTDGSLQLQIEFYSSTALAQSQPLYFGLIDLALIQKGDTISVSSDGQKITTSGQFKPTGARPGEMIFTSANPSALNSLTEIQVGGKDITNGASIDPIKMTNADGSICGLIDGMEATWNVKEISSDGKSLPIHIGANFSYTPDTAMTPGKCSATAVLTAVY